MLVARSRLVHTAELLEQSIAEGLQLGAQLCVLRGGETIADLALGEAAPGEAMTPATLVLWLSSTKPVAAVAIAQLWEGGRLELDDPVARHLPGFAAGGKGAITIRHLLTHTGGFRMLDVGFPHDAWDEILSRVCAARLEPRWVPGRKAGYHLASSWFVLGELVRRLAGRPFPEYVREAIFLPLGMSDCWIGMPAERFDEYGARLGRMFDTERRPPAPHPWHERSWVTGCSPGGNGWGPMRQLARFYEALRRGGELDSRRILGPQTVEALVARHRVGLLDHTFRASLDWGLGFIPNSAWQGDPRLPYGYGPHASARAFGHSGARSSAAFCDPEHGLVVALHVNGTPSEETHRERFSAVLAALYEDLGLVPAEAIIHDR